MAEGIRLRPSPGWSSFGIARALLRCAAGLFLVLFALAWLLSRPQAQLPTRRFWLGGQEIVLEVATTQRQIARGLMFRSSLPQQSGMLFEFDELQEQCFWMRDTAIPLSVAFMDAERRIFKIVDMHPQSRQLHCSGAPVGAALEMNQGWFAANGVGPGAVLISAP